jgi:molybdopterin/thiamine biosynthesis adenylyltransferase/rhodanese-related sulfurtransferase/molybdopterin converting factor small subunit
MAIRVFLPGPLRVHFGGRAAVDVEAGTAGEALAKLTAGAPALRAQLFTDEGALRSFVNVYVNDEDIRAKEGDRTPLVPGDTLSIVPSIAGGADGPGAAVDPDKLAAAQAAMRQAGKSNIALDHDEVRRYSRHLILPEVGLAGQTKLKNSRVLLIGVGGLGSPLALYLSAAGVGTLGLVDADVVDESNLQRQVIHGTSDVGRPKLDSAGDRIADINPHVNVEKHEMMLNSENALELFKQYDVVADGTDNFPTRYLVNDACVLTGKPNVYGSIFRFEGQASVFATKDGPCYRCLYPEPPPPGAVPSCAEGGVLGILPGIIGLVQATEVVKLVLGVGEPLIGRLLLFDALAMQFRTLKLRKDPACPVCGPNPTVTALIDYQQFCGFTPGHDAPAGDMRTITATALKQRLDKGEDVAILDVREPQEFELCRIPGSRLVPLGELPARLSELDSTKELVVHCRTGKRSAQAIELLQRAGFTGSLLANLEGGIDAWARDVDPTMPRY